MTLPKHTKPQHPKKAGCRQCSCFHIRERQVKLDMELMNFLVLQSATFFCRIPKGIFSYGKWHPLVLSFSSLGIYWGSSHLANGIIQRVHYEGKISTFVPKHVPPVPDPSLYSRSMIFFLILPSLKLTASSPLQIGRLTQKERIIFQPFRGHVSFREGTNQEHLHLLQMFALPFLSESILPWAMIVGRVEVPVAWGAKQNNCYVPILSELHEVPRK